MSDSRYYFRILEHAPFTTHQTWHNRVWNNALKMQIKCQANLCHSLAFQPVFRTTPPHLRKTVPQASGDSKTKHDKMLNIVLGPFIQQKQERRKKEERRKKKEKGERKIYLYILNQRKKKNIYIYVQRKKEGQKKKEEQRKNKEERRKKKKKKEKKRKEKKRKAKTRKEKKGKK